MRILITGINGFIGSHFLEYALSHTDWDIVGVDLVDDNIRDYESGFEFHRLDIRSDVAAIEDLLRGADVVMLLAGVARPAEYVAHPMHVFELDFEYNLTYLRMCARYGKRLIFPSTSEVYGIGGEEPMNEWKSNLVTGPVHEMRWIYSASKQLMDRVIFALAQEEGLRFSIIRPFNWVGPRLDSFALAQKREARVLTQMLYDMIYNQRIILAGDGTQRRSFTYVGDGIEALARIIDAEEQANGKVFNIGNQDNNYSVKELADLLLERAKNFAPLADYARRTVVELQSYTSLFGDRYADTRNRIPDISTIENLLSWHPHTTMEEILDSMLQWVAE